MSSTESSGLTSSTWRRVASRQWLLLSRREPYRPGEGQHRLRLNIGGSAGQSGRYDLDVCEGQLELDFRGRRLDVRVSEVADSPDAAAEKPASRARRSRLPSPEALVIKWPRPAPCRVATTSVKSRGQQVGGATFPRRRPRPRKSEPDVC
jgi:hypothetical protein